MGISGVRRSNAGELGLGGTALSQIAKSNDGIFVHGARSYDNNFQLNGVSVSDVQGSATGSGGIPLPNPDSIQEFKVQTGLYDAGYGRYAGANVSLLTKSGSLLVSVHVVYATVRTGKPVCALLAISRSWAFTVYRSPVNSTSDFTPMAWKQVSMRKKREEFADRVFNATKPDKFEMLWSRSPSRA